MAGKKAAESPPASARVLVLSDSVVDGTLYRSGAVVEFPAETAARLVATDAADGAPAAVEAALLAGVVPAVHAPA